MADSKNKRECSPEERAELVEKLSESGLALDASPECVANMAVLKGAGAKPDFTVTRVYLKATWEANDIPGDIAQGNRGFILGWETVSAGFGELTVWSCPEGNFCETEGMSKRFVREVLAKFAESLEVAG